MSAQKRTVFAAGGVLWRPTHGGKGVEIALIHRPRYDDWTLPKGKRESGENLVATAVREIAEETGCSTRLGRRLSTVAYDIGAGRKVVHYWSARWCAGEFRVNDEVDELRWMSPADAAGGLSYKADRKVLAEFTRLPADLHTVLVVRHAKAGRASRYRGDDRLRPLERVGRLQAEKIVDQARAFGARHVHSADRTRCLQTVEPLALALDTGITVERTLSEEAYRSDPAPALARIREIAALDGTHIVCSQGKVIPGLMQSWVGADGVSLPRARNRKASMWVVSMLDGAVVAADHVDSPLR
ncbi:NUDIX hydrolase [Williamsia serinedens]|uniref:8-oxo-dGTP diphosphatase n=1 Tax=Williamsia serinedens TaxID=391736 RepID=A0ABT1H1B5_9NOCA|nr:NUDIX domain-containing protein [Williamsia serinedens]MCP2161031.1 8-oxo-dGTP diphosphatase [Williamsia serinedens]